MPSVDFNRAMEVTIAICKKFEGLHALRADGLVYPYICPAGYPTQGYGHLVPDMSSAPWTRNNAEEILRADLQHFQRYTLPLVNVPSLTSERLGALTSFSFNVGLGALKISTMRKRILEEDWEEAADQILRWNRGGGRVLAGLSRRREAERLYLL